MNESPRTSPDSRRAWYFAGVALAFLVFAVLVFGSSHDDWDGVLTGYEVDLRSWLIDGKAPLWSYQICSGVTRLGDPLSLGLSPLFLFFVIFGSFWGAKLLMLGLAALGYFSFYRLLLLMAPEDAPADVRVALASLSLFLNAGNYYLGHSVIGHISFWFNSFVFLMAFCAAYLVLRRWDWRLALTFFAAGFTFFAGGFYHSLVFLLLPLLALSALGALSWRLRDREFRWPVGAAFRLAGVAAIALLAVLLTAYKWLPVLRYQAEFPRVIPAINTEGVPFYHLFAYFFVPTYDLLFPGGHDFLDFFNVYEYSAFSYLSVLVIAALAWYARRPRPARSWWPELALAWVIALQLPLGSRTILPIYTWINHGLFHDSLRAVGRFHILLLVLAAVSLAKALVADPKFRGFYLRYLLLPGMVLVPLEMLTYAPRFDFGQSLRQASLSVAPVSRMRDLIVVHPRVLYPRMDSYMYPAVKAGLIVLNCYDPLMRLTMVASEEGIANPSIAANRHELPLLNPGKIPVSEDCRRSAYVTQNEIFFDRAACPPDLCFNVNMLDPWRPAPLALNKERGLYCVP